MTAHVKCKCFKAKVIRTEVQQAGLDDSISIAIGSPLVVEEACWSSGALSLVVILRIRRRVKSGMSGV